MPAKRTLNDFVPPKQAPVVRGRSSRASKASLASDENESESFSTRPAKRARGAGAKSAKQGDGWGDDGFEDHHGRRSSKPATIEQHLMEQNKKSKEFVQEFKKQVTQGWERNQERLAQLKHELSSHVATDNLSDTRAALQTAASHTTPSTKDNPLLEQTRQLIRLGRAILSCHQKAEQKTRITDLASPRETWKQDEEGMRKLLAYGRLHAERVVEGWITPMAEELNDNEDYAQEGSGSDAEDLARGLFEWKRKARAALEGQESWGVAARKQMVALAGVVKSLDSSAAGGKDA